MTTNKILTSYDGPAFADALRKAVDVALGHDGNCTLAILVPRAFDTGRDRTVYLTVTRHHDDGDVDDPRLDLTVAEWRAALLSALLPEIDTLHVPAPSYTPSYDIVSELVGSIQDDVKAANDGHDLTAKAWRTLTFGMVLAHAIGEQHGAADPDAVAKRQAAEKKRGTK